MQMKSWREQRRRNQEHVTASESPVFLRVKTLETTWMKGRVTVCVCVCVQVNRWLAARRSMTLQHLWPDENRDLGSRARLFYSLPVILCVISSEG